MEIKVLGTGCANCKNTFDLIAKTAEELGVTVALEKIEDLPIIMQYGVMTTPGVVIDEKVVHAGGIPDSATIKEWLAGATDNVSGDNKAGGCCGGSDNNNNGCC